MPEEKKKETRRRRLKGKALGELRARMKGLERAVKAMQTKRDDILDAHDAFRDQVNWNTGIIYDVGEKKPDGRGLQAPTGEAEDKGKPSDRVPIGRITKEEEKAERACRREVEHLDSEIGDLKWELAEKLGCMPNDIDTTTGEITGTPVIQIDPDDTQPMEVAAAEDADPEGDVPLSMGTASAK